VNTKHVLKFYNIGRLEIPGDSLMAENEILF